MVWLLPSLNPSSIVRSTQYSYRTPNHHYNHLLHPLRITHKRLLDHLCVLLARLLACTLRDKATKPGLSPRSILAQRMIVSLQQCNFPVIAPWIR